MKYRVKKEFEYLNNLHQVNFSFEKVGSGYFCKETGCWFPAAWVEKDTEYFEKVESKRERFMNELKKYYCGYSDYDRNKLADIAEEIYNDK